MSGIFPDSLQLGNVEDLTSVFSRCLIILVLASGPAWAQTVDPRIQEFDDALRAARVANQPAAIAKLLESKARRLGDIGKQEEAVPLWTEVIDRYRALNIPIGVAIALDARCHIQYEAGHYAESLADARAAIAAFTALKQPASPASYSRAGMASLRLGRDTEGRQWLADAEARIAAAPDYEQVQTLTQLGISYVMLGDAPNANRAYNRVLALARRRSSLEDEWKAQLGLGRTALMAHDPETAIGHLEQAVTVIERLRATVPAEELRAAYLSRRVEAHEWLATALMMQSASPSDAYVERAFDVAERARVRALSDLLAEGRAKRGADQPVPAPTVRTRAAIAANLAPGEVLLEYLVGEEHAYGWALSREGIVGFELPAPSELDADVRQALAYIDADDRDGLRRLTEDLTPALLGPVLQALSTTKRIIFVPDGPLQRLPFAALPLPDGESIYLVQRVAISTVGSGSLLQMLQRSESAHGVLALASSPASDRMRGDGLLSLARSFMEAGARSVVASLWDVGDRDTRVLMRNFYAGIAAGLPPDQALRISQLQMIRAGGSLAAPKVWAAFQVEGEARQPVWERRPTSIPAIAVTALMLAGIAVLLRL